MCRKSHRPQLLLENYNSHKSKLSEQQRTENGVRTRLRVKTRTITNDNTAHVSQIAQNSDETEFLEPETTNIYGLERLVFLVFSSSTRMTIGERPSTTASHHYLTSVSTMTRLAFTTIHPITTITRVRFRTALMDNSENNIGDDNKNAITLRYILDLHYAIGLITGKIEYWEVLGKYCQTLRIVDMFI